MTEVGLPAETSVPQDATGPALPDSGSGRQSRLPRMWSTIGVIIVAVGALIGGNVFGLRDRLTGTWEPTAQPVAVSRNATQTSASIVAPQESVLRSYPWWQTLTTFQGTGSPATPPSFTIGAKALQWKIDWSCTSGQLSVRASTEKSLLVNTTCPDSGTSYGSATGPTTLTIAAGATWQIDVAQQVDVPLVEPPTVTMTSLASKVVASGSLYNVDQSGSGNVTFYMQPDGSYALRLENFFITPNVDLEIDLSPLGSIHSTTQYVSTPSTFVARLDVTTGSINFPVPAGVDPLTFHSLAIWCPTITSLYAAANLTPQP